MVFVTGDTHADFRRFGVKHFPEQKTMTRDDTVIVTGDFGILDDTTRYNTPEIAAQQLLFTDGIFLSEELGRSVTADEIRAMSPSLYLREQDIGSEVLKFDTEF